MFNPLLTRTADELLDIVPPKEGIVRTRSDGHIWSARTYCARLHDAGIGIRFPSLGNHDFRAEGLSAIGK